MNWKGHARRLADWTIPPAIQQWLRVRVSHSAGMSSVEARERAAILSRNCQFRNKHRGARCFVLATGSSIREQNLKALRNEWCIACSEFFKHADYRLIRPAYYAFMPTHGPLTGEIVERKLKRLEVVKGLAQDEVFFFGLRDKDWVETSALRDKSERIHYVDYSGDLQEPEIDLNSRVPFPHGAAIMATWIAIYMGFSEIYLVGCDHDHLWKWDGLSPFTKESAHFYDGNPDTGFELMDLDDALRTTLMARRHYAWTSRVAQQQGTAIYTANPRNYLNVVPRVNLADLFEGKDGSGGATS